MNDDTDQQQSNWRSLLDDRQLNELGLCNVYVNDFNHGTSGHLEKHLISRLGLFLDALVFEGVDVEGVLKRNMKEVGWK